MARHIDHQVEGKRIQQYNITKLCGTVKDIHTGFSRMQEMSLPSECGVWMGGSDAHEVSVCSDGLVLPIVSLSDLSSLDRHWLQGLEYSGWMALACSCLVLAKEVAHTLCVKKKCAMLLGMCVCVGWGGGGMYKGVWCLYMWCSGRMGCGAPN